MLGYYGLDDLGKIRSESPPSCYTNDADFYGRR